MFSLRHEEEFPSPSFCVTRQFKKNEGKLGNCSFREHIGALPLATAVAVLLPSDLGDQVADVVADPVRM